MRYSVIEFDHGSFYSSYLYFLRYAEFLKSKLREKYTYTSTRACWCKSPKRKALKYLQNSETFKNPSIHPPSYLSVCLYLFYQFSSDPPVIFFSRFPPRLPVLQRRQTSNSSPSPFPLPIPTSLMVVLVVIFLPLTNSVSAKSSVVRI